MARTTQGADDAELIPPVPASDVKYGEDDLLAPGDERMPPTWSIVAGVSVLLIGAIALAVGKQAGHHTAKPAPSAIASEASLATQQQVPQIGRPIGLGTTSAVDLAMAGGQLYVLTEHPATLGQIDTRTGRPGQEVDLAAGAEHVVVDPVAQLVWVVADDRVFAYEAGTLNALGEIGMSRSIITVAALDGRLFINTDHGIYQAEPRDAEATLVPGFSGQVLQALTADWGRHRLIAVTSNYELLEVTSRRVRLVRTLQGFLPESIIVTRAGIWAVGFGTVGGSRIARVDPGTLKFTALGAVDPDAPQGAEGWGGESVIWTRLPYDDSISCRDARTGATVQTFPNTIEQVVSARGFAYGRSAGTVVRLSTTRRCPG